MALKDVKNHLSEVVDQVEREHERVVITKHGRPAAVVVSVEGLTSLEETLDIAGRPQLMRQIRASLTELAAGEAEVLTKDEILRTPHRMSQEQFRSPGLRRRNRRWHGFRRRLPPQRWRSSTAVWPRIRTGLGSRRVAGSKVRTALDEETSASSTGSLTW